MQTSQKLPITKLSRSSTHRSSRGDFFISSPGRLDLADGTSFSGIVPNWQTTTYVGEVVFNTGMTGYVESLTDPSYANQILVFTFPLIGNYGVQLDAAESDQIQVNGVVVSEAALYASHSDSAVTFLDWLQSQNIPILVDVDTRALTKHIRVKGTMLGAIGVQPTKPLTMQLEPKIISVSKPIVYNPTGKKTVILVDCGAKQNIQRSLLKLGVRVKRVPYNYDYTTEDYDGVVLSNGPGDPIDYAPTIAVTKKALKLAKPVFGICLGNQILGLAAGANTYKLKYGHRGHNQPCLQGATNRGFITSQNHGYAVDEQSLPTGWFASFKNLNDGSVEGIEHRSKPFFAVQFHPEACPGPTDTAWLFERFYKVL